MDRHPRQLPLGDRLLAGVVLTAGAAALAGAPLLAAPWALADGWQSPRALIYIAATAAAAVLGCSAGACVVDRLRRAGRSGEETP